MFVLGMHPCIYGKAVIKAVINTLENIPVFRIFAYINQYMVPPNFLI